MDKIELLKRISELTGKSLLIQFCDKNKADLTYETAKKLQEEGKVNIEVLIRRNNFSIYIQASIK